MSNQNTEEKNENPQDQSKVEKKFSAAIEKLTAILSGEDKLKPVKRLPNDSISQLVEDLFKEEKETLYAEVKTNLKDLLKKYHELLKSIKEKEAELQKIANSKKEEFVKAAQSLFDKIQNVDEVKTSYYEGLKSATLEDRG